MTPTPTPAPRWHRPRPSRIGPGPMGPAHRRPGRRLGGPGPLGRKRRRGGLGRPAGQRRWGRIGQGDLDLGLGRCTGVKGSTATTTVDWTATTTFSRLTSASSSAVAVPGDCVAVRGSGDHLGHRRLGGGRPRLRVPDPARRPRWRLGGGGPGGPGGGPGRGSRPRPGVARPLRAWVSPRPATPSPPGSSPAADRPGHRPVVPGMGGGVVGKVTAVGSASFTVSSGSGGLTVKTSSATSGRRSKPPTPAPWPSATASRPAAPQTEHRHRHLDPHHRLGIVQPAHRRSTPDRWRSRRRLHGAPARSAEVNPPGLPCPRGVGNPPVTPGYGGAGGADRPGPAVSVGRMVVAVAGIPRTGGGW